MTIILPTLKCDNHPACSNSIDLFDTNHRALNAVLHAISELKGAAPKPRDYYPQDPTGLTGENAIREHWKRIHALQAVAHDLVTITEYIRVNDHNRLIAVE